MVEYPSHNMIGELEADARKREAFLDQLTSIIESTLSKSDVTGNKKIANKEAF
ncbi:hypothetical protein [Paucisalibacillus globulus]|uniref:hypothetical protein n=1 Tax=Paucisalibacillus globulus TaxID=351095 RepID=UPI0004264FCD|nr:hypothetical protein [Paucisalibacillus globulus]